MRDGCDVLILQHVAVESPGRILPALEQVRATPRIVRVDLGEPVPRVLEGFAGLVVMGGPMGVYETERHPHLRDELALIEDGLKRRAPVLGVCLGSQLLAAALGARVYPSGGKEIGWLEVRLTAAARSDPAFARVADRFRPLHWHGDVFDLPAGAVSLASSDATPHQAFRAEGSALGLLFHLEVTPAQVARMSETFAAELDASDRAALLGTTERESAEIERVAASVFSSWAEAARAGVASG